MAESDDDFLGRWSRRKRGARVVAKTAAPAVQTEPPAKALAKAPNPAPGEAPDETPDETAAADLPDPDTLGPDDDFTIYLKDNVPEAIRNRALRRLWRSDPVLANLDGLIDYGGDFTNAATVVAGLKTLYQVGRGFVVEEDEKKDKGKDEGETPAPAAGAPGPESETLAESTGPHAIETVAEPAGPASDPAAVAAPRTAARHAAAAPKVHRRGALERRWGGGRGDTESGSS